MHVVVNGKSPETVTWLETFSHPAFSWIEIPEEPRTVARNRAFSARDFDIVYFLDDDVEVPEPLLARALERFASDPSLAVLGGPNLTPPASTFQEKLYGAVMTSPFAAPMVRARYEASRGDRPATERELILCNLALRRRAIPEGLRFLDHLRGSEENLFLFECRERGLEARFSPELQVFHHRRSTLPSFVRQIFWYGYGRAQQTWLAPRSCHPAFLAPSVACLFAATGAAIPSLRGLTLTLLAVHAAGGLLGAVASREMRGLGARAVALAPPLTLIVHAAYGTGLLVGLGQAALTSARALGCRAARALFAALLPLLPRAQDAYPARREPLS